MKKTHLAALVAGIVFAVMLLLPGTALAEPIKIEKGTRFTINAGGIDTFNGESYKPKVTIKDNNLGYTLVEGTDFTVEYGENMHTDDLKVIVTGIGNYTGTLDLQKWSLVSLNKANLSQVGKITISQSSFVYTGKTIDPMADGLITVTATFSNGKTVTLKHGEDYKIVYRKTSYTSDTADPVMPATYIAEVVTYKKNFFISRDYNQSKPLQVRFTIKPADINSAYDASKTVINKGTPEYFVGYSKNHVHKPTVSFTLGSETYYINTSTNHEGTNNDLFELTYKESAAKRSGSTLQAGDQITMIVTPRVNMTGYTGSLEIPCIIQPFPLEGVPGGDNVAKEGLFVAFAVASENKSRTFEYTGKAVTPAVKVTFLGGSPVLEEGKDYTVSYKNNVKSGTKDDANGPVAVVTLKGNYTGTAELHFTIGTPLSEKNVELNPKEYTYDGKVKTPSATVTLDGKTLKSGTDYTVSYSSNINAGTAKATITGMGTYAGTVEKSFTINPAKLSSVTAANQTYDGKAKKPTPTVKAGSLTVPASGYTASYTNNTKSGIATVKVTGKGNYTGTVSATFKISPKSISSATITGVTDKAWTGKAITQTPTVKDGSTTLKSGTDYTVSYKNNVNAGTATVTITGKGNYTGSVSKTFKITKAVEAKSVPVYWLQHKTAKENLYTTDKHEVAKLSEGNWINKGIVWYAPTTGTPVYRLYAKSINDHHYTADANEVKTLTAKGTWKVDSGKPMWYSGGNVRTYRMFNPTRNAKRLPGTHRFATSQAEVNTLKKQGWVMDDVKMYGVKVK